MRGRRSNTMKFPIRERHRRKISKCSADVVLRGKRVNAVTCDAAETHPGEDKIACTMILRGRPRLRLLDAALRALLRQAAEYGHGYDGDRHRDATLRT